MQGNEKIQGNEKMQGNEKQIGGKKNIKEYGRFESENKVRHKFRLKPIVGIDNQYGFVVKRKVHKGASGQGIVFLPKIYVGKEVTVAVVPFLGQGAKELAFDFAEVNGELEEVKIF